MKSILRRVCDLLILISAVSGCSMISMPPQTHQVAHAHLQSELVQDTLMGEIVDRPPVDFTRVQPGHYCKLTIAEKAASGVDKSTGTGNGRDADAQSTSRIAGRIVAVDDQQIVLADAIQIHDLPNCIEGSPVPQSGFTSRFFPPYRSRLFKRSGVGHRTTSLPGEVRVDRSSVDELEAVDGTNWSVVQQRGVWFERVGVNFDFHAAGAGRSDRDLAATSQ